MSVPIIAGAGSNATASAVEQTERASELGVDAILSVTPYYNRPSQAGLEAHFRAVAAATELPVMLYDIPVRTGRKIDTDTILRLAHDVPNIVGAQGRGRRPGRDRPPDGRGAIGLRGLQRRRLPDAAPARRRRRRAHLGRVATGSAASSAR